MLLERDANDDVEAGGFQVDGNELYPKAEITHLGNKNSVGGSPLEASCKRLNALTLNCL